MVLAFDFDDFPRFELGWHMRHTKSSTAFKASSAARFVEAEEAVAWVISATPANR
jgi:hypothetical protein